MHAPIPHLAQRGISVVHQSPYFPYLNLCDRYLFRAIKQESGPQEWQLWSFDSPEAIGKAIQRSIWQIPENTLLDQLKKLRDHCHLVIVVNGDYFYQINWNFDIIHYTCCFIRVLTIFFEQPIIVLCSIICFSAYTPTNQIVPNIKKEGRGMIYFCFAGVLLLVK